MKSAAQRTSNGRFVAWSGLLLAAMAVVTACADSTTPTPKLSVGFKTASAAGFGPSTVMASDASVGIPPATEVPTIVNMAQTGQFDRVSTMLKSDPEELKKPEVKALVDEIENFRKQRVVQDGKRLAEFNKSVDKTKKAQTAGRLEESLGYAVEARILATDPDAFLRTDLVVAISRQAQTKVAAAEKEGDWVEALSLYRLLDALFDDHGTYRNNVKRVSEHLRLLRIYTPDELEKLLKARNDRLKAAKAAETQPVAETQPLAEKKIGNAEPAKTAVKEAMNDDAHIEKDKWQDRLEDVEMPMLQQFLSDAARQHVMNKGYRPLLVGALNDLEIFADTTALGEAFPAMKDKEKLAAFKGGLVKLQNDIGKVETYGFSDSMDTLSKVLDLNKDTIGLPEAVLVYEMAEGSVSTLDDFSAIIWPYDKEAFGRNFAGKFYGVGILIRMKDERIYVDSPIENSPALKAGIKSGDFIVKVDGADTTGWSLDQIVRKITGPKGTTVNVGIERGAKADILNFKLTRDEIQIESVKGWQRAPNNEGWDYYIDKESQIGYIRLSQFIPQSSDDIDRAVNQMQNDKGLKGLILDLRQNPGGLLTAAVNIVNKFVSSGIIVSTAGLDAKPTQEFYAQPKNAYKPFPVIVLINEGSASASEIVSGALQDYHRALIMGSRSYGKGSVQDVFQIDQNKAFVKITTQYYRLPSGRIIHRQPEARTWGIEPDLKIDVTPQAEFDEMEARQKLDVLHQPGEAPAATQDAALSVDSLINDAVDAQLAAALIVMKTELLAERDKAVLAQIPAPPAVTTQPVAK